MPSHLRLFSAPLVPFRFQEHGYIWQGCSPGIAAGGFPTLLVHPGYMELYDHRLAFGAASIF